MQRADSAVAAPEPMRCEMTIAPNDATKVAEPVILVLYQRVGKGAHPHHLVAGCEMRPARVALFRAGHELPAVLGKKSVIRSGNELRAVFERYSVRWLDHAPVSEHARLHVAPIPAFACGAVDQVAWMDVRNPPHAAVRHQDRRIAVDTVDASMLTSPIRVDRLRKADVGRIVARDDRARALLGDAGLELGGILFLGRPAVVERLARERLEAAGDERARAPQVSCFVF